MSEKSIEGKKTFRVLSGRDSDGRPCTTYEGAVIKMKSGYVQLEDLFEDLGIETKHDDEVEITVKVVSRVYVERRSL